MYFHVFCIAFEEGLRPLNLHYLKHALNVHYFASISSLKKTWLFNNLSWTHITEGWFAPTLTQIWSQISKFTMWVKKGNMVRLPLCYALLGWSCLLMSFLDLCCRMKLLFSYVKKRMKTAWWDGYAKRRASVTLPSSSYIFLNPNTAELLYPEINVAYIKSYM